MPPVPVHRLSLSLSLCLLEAQGELEMLESSSQHDQRALSSATDESCRMPTQVQPQDCTTVELCVGRGVMSHGPLAMGVCVSVCVCVSSLPIPKPKHKLESSCPAVQFSSLSHESMVSQVFTTPPAFAG